MAVLLGSENLSVIEEVVLLSSQTYTALRTGIAEVTCIGGGGQGGCSARAQDAITNITGGGAGGYSRKRIAIKAGDTFTVVVGAGGNDANQSPNNSGNEEDGNDGGESTFTNDTAISTIALDSNGGIKGIANQTTTASGATYAGGAGGTASGGDVNYTGGRGGTITRSNNAPNSGSIATGGGAVAINGVAYNGGDVAYNSSTNLACATGGAGIGGNGGSVTTNANQAISACGTAGGSASQAGRGLSSTQAANAGNTAQSFGATDDYGVKSLYNPAGVPSYGGFGLGQSANAFGPAGRGGDGFTPSNATFASFNARDPSYGNTNSSLMGLPSRSTTVGYENVYFGPGGGGGGCVYVGTTTNHTSAGGSGAIFGGGGALLDNCGFIQAGNSGASMNGKGGFGGGSGGFKQGYNSTNSSTLWAGGGNGVVIIQYLG